MIWIQNWPETAVLITGGTGSLGQALVAQLLERNVRKIVVFSRDEAKQQDMQTRWPENASSSMRYLIGDVRGRDRLRRALHGIDLVLHCAALKQVPTCERDPWEAVDTNISGTRNVIEAAIDDGVKRVMVVSTDKAVAPVVLYGATKLVAERMAVAANAYAGAGPTRIACVRYGNVVGSRGSVLHVWRKQRETGTIELTDLDSTRFWIVLADAARFVLGCCQIMQGREVFIPRLSASRIADLAEAVAPGIDWRIIGLRAGEKRHEVLISPDEVDRTWAFVAPGVAAFGFGLGEYLRGYLIWPTVEVPSPAPYILDHVPPDFVYSSDRAPCLSLEKLRAMAESVV